MRLVFHLLSALHQSWAESVSDKNHLLKCSIRTSGLLLSRNYLKVESGKHPRYTNMQSFGAATIDQKAWKKRPRWHTLVACDPVVLCTSPLCTRP